MEKEVEEVKIEKGWLKKAIDRSTEAYRNNIYDEQEFEYWRGYRDALYAVLEAIEGEKDE